MSEEEIKQQANPVDDGETQVADGSQTEKIEYQPSPVEKAAGVAAGQANEAAGALRHGELMQDATLDIAASSDDRLIAMLAYATQIIIPVVMPIIVLLSESSKKRPFQRYHAVQSLAMMITLIALSGAVTIATAIIQIVPFIGQVIGLLVLCLSPIVYLMVLVAFLYYGYQAYQGKRFAIPGLTGFLRDQGWV